MTISAGQPDRPKLAARLGDALTEIVVRFDRTPDWLIAALARFSVATVFWRSGRTKVDGWSLNDTAIMLFEEEYQVPLVPPEAAAYMATIAEHVFPVLIIVGLATRFSALALLFMTAVIQLFVYPDAWPVHAFWATALLYLIARGPGALSLDYLLRRNWANKS